MYQSVLDSKKPDFEKAIEFFRSEAGKIRTGRASASLVEDLPVECYGAKSPLKQVASINVPEPRLIVISPWDRGSLQNIEKAVRESDLSLSPVNDGVVIRINIPALNEERRRDLAKVLNGKAEESRVAVRKIREEIVDEVQGLEKEGKIGEDDKFQAKEKIQKMVDEFNARIEEIRRKKEDEIMTV